MNIKKIVEKLDLLPDKEKIIELKRETSVFTDELRRILSLDKIEAEVFVGGSFAKETMMKQEEYEIDIFVRFNWKYSSLSDALEKVLKKLTKKMKLELKRVHGSRDYFKIAKEGIIFEVIPVVKINHVKEARNVTDLSYFHVLYLKKKLTKKMKLELKIAKKFCKTQKVYGAESYINGFSGYGLECLIIYYNTFENMLRNLTKIKDGEKKIIDLENFYKNKNEVYIELSEPKLASPIILIDPTWKERNVLAALSHETFKKFQETAKKFLKKPGIEFFNSENIKKRAKVIRAEAIELEIRTEHQEGDIAGTKMKKFSSFLLREISRYFNIFDKEFLYESGKKAKMYIAAKSKKEFLKIGPPLERKEDVKKFKIKNKSYFIKNNVLHSRIRIKSGLKPFLQDYFWKNKSKIRAMGISDLKIIS